MIFVIASFLLLLEEVTFVNYSDQLIRLCNVTTNNKNPILLFIIIVYNTVMQLFLNPVTNFSISPWHLYLAHLMEYISHFPCNKERHGFSKRVEKELTDIYYHAKNISEGSPASYIPELARVNPNLFGIALCDSDGYFWSIGDDAIPFTLQSCVKPILYNVALTLVGDRVHDHIGHEPSGKRFNAFALDSNNKPHNPMINTGAIMAAAIIRAQFSQQVYRQ